MRILLLAHAPSIHTQRWAEALLARGHDVRLLSAADAPGARVPVARRIGVSWGPHTFRYASGRGAVRAEFRDFRPDVTVAHFLPNYGFLGALAGASPLFLSCWGSDLLVNAERSSLHRARARWTLRRANAIHVDAAVLAEAAIRLGADPNRVWTRAWGVDPDAVTPRDAAAARLACREALRILWTRQLEPLYAPESFVAGLAKLAAMNVPFRATMAGSGPLRASIEALAHRLGIGDRVTLVGWVDPPRLHALLRDHDVYVSLSHSDSTSQALLEAMAAELVPIVSDIAGNREWVRHRREGLLVPVDDPDALACALAEVKREPVPAGEMASRARAAVLSRGRFADTVQELERRLLDLAGRVPAVRAIEARA